MKDLLVFLAEGFEEIEALTVVDYLRRVDLKVDLVSINDNLEVKSSHNVLVKADKSIQDIDLEEYRGLYIPGGLPGATNLADSEYVRNAVKKYNEEEKLVAAICAGPVVLDRCGLLEENKFTCYPGYEGNLSVKDRLDKAVVKNGNIVTSMGPSLAQVLAFELIKILGSEEKAEEVKKGVLFNKL